MRNIVSVHPTMLAMTAEGLLNYLWAGGDRRRKKRKICDIAKAPARDAVMENQLEVKVAI